jgi:NADH dehydrogenase FAD-containing subunit
MLPGTLAGQFRVKEMEIDLEALCLSADAELMLAEVNGLDTETSTLHFANAQSLHFDVLSIGVGSMPAGWVDMQSESLVPIKPMSTFLNRLDGRLRQSIRSRAPHESSLLRISVVGGGVASIEIALCLQNRLRDQFKEESATIQILTAASEIASELRPRSIRRIRQILGKRGIAIVTNTRVTKVSDRTLVAFDGTQYQADCVIWATGAVPPPLLGKLSLPTDERGFIATESTLRTIANWPIFAVGDSGTVIDDPAPKAGVYAVRQSPILWHNLQAVLSGGKLIRFVPQRDFLKLLNTGDGKALLQYKSLTFYGRWCWWLKTYIDKRFVKRFQIGGDVK